MGTKGIRSLYREPFRYGGFLHNYELDVEEFAKGVPNISKCYCCGGKMRNSRSDSGTLLRRNYPYAATYKYTKGKNKGFYHLKPLCRACAYGYGKGVIEMDGKLYIRPSDFSEGDYKRKLHESNIKNSGDTE